MSTFIVKSPKPRNPLVAAARSRSAGRHGNRAGATRRAGRAALRRELALMDPAPSRPPHV